MDLSDSNDWEKEDAIPKAKTKKSFDAFWFDLIKYRLKFPTTEAEARLAYKYTNGCGSMDGASVPNTIGFVSVESACHKHDIKWGVATCYQDLLDANDEFTGDIKRICDYESNWFTNFLRRQIIALWSYGVDKLGTDSYARKRGFINDV